MDTPYLTTENNTPELPTTATGPETTLVPFIPKDINNLGLAESARYYHEKLGFAVHPLQQHDRGPASSRGKKPLLQGWRGHDASNVDQRFFDTHFGPGSKSNLGFVLSGNQLVIDLDSKSDSGKSVDQWLSGQPQLSKFPRERTAGGAHIHLSCPDMPDWLNSQKKALVTQINEMVTAELYFSGLNVVLSPSIHSSGHKYSWEIMGDIPIIFWEELKRLVAFPVPEPDKPKDSKKKWWKNREEDLRTLDLVALMEELEIEVRCLDPDTYKFAVKCPWADEHSKDEHANGGATVFFNVPGKIPAFNCLHAHCHGRKMEQFLDWADSVKPGIVSAHCSRNRSDEPLTQSPDGRPRVILPMRGRSQRDFGTDLGKALASAAELFIYQNSVVTVSDTEADSSQSAGEEAPTLLVTVPVNPIQLITLVEGIADIGFIVTKDGQQDFIPFSMNIEIARITLENKFFRKQLPKLRRLLTVPIPHRTRDGDIFYPKVGYDGRLKSWLSPNAPAIVPMNLQAAVRLIRDELLVTSADGGFCWADEQSFTHAVARLITPFCRGLMNWKRAAFFIFEGNREGCGKDTCASLALVLYTGQDVREAPLAKHADEEMRKRISSAIIAGHQFFHLANMKGHIDFQALESATDNAGFFADRVLGASQIVIMPIEMEFSMSTNNGTWTPDIERRCRIIKLFFSGENVNNRTFKHPDILGWVRGHRSEILSAIAALVNEWVRQGSPSGPSPFSSFPEWANVVGGILTCCGFSDPCLPHQEIGNSGDQTTISMRGLFQVAFENFEDCRLPKSEFQKFLGSNQVIHDLFDWIDFTQQRGLASFGKLISKYGGRELGGILMTIKKTSKNHMTYEFSRPTADSQAGSASSDASSVAEEGARETKGVFQASPGNQVVAKGSELSRKPEFPQPARKTSLKLPSSLPTVVCTKLEDLKAAALDLVGHPRIALDIETYGPGKKDGLNPWRGEIRLLTLYRENGTVWSLDLKAIGYELGPIKEVLERAEIIAHNAKFDVLWLFEKCGLKPASVCCTMTASRLLSAGTKPGNNLDQCLKRYLGVSPAPDLSLSKWAQVTLSPEQYEYAVRDVAYLHDLLAELESALEEADLSLVWELECMLLLDVVAIESNGIHVDRVKLQSIIADSKNQAQDSTQKVRQILGEPDLNVGSPNQLLAALAKHGIKLASSNEETLKSVSDHPVIPMILEFREASKRSQQAEALLGHIESDGRIHARFEPTGTVTGRFSSKTPNLQSVSHGVMREAFCAPEGRTLISADYSQIELRIAAAIANEGKMIAAYQSKADLHKMTAAHVLGKSEDDVTKEDRQLAKAVNFGLLYGQNAAGLVRYAASSYNVTLDEIEAECIRSRFFQAYPRLKSWHQSGWSQDSPETCETRTPTGRRRIIPAESSRWDRFTALINTPVQGGAAEVMKAAIFIAMGRLPQDARIVATVHDELLVECAALEAESVLEIVVASMTEAMGIFFPQVPVAVEAGICANWSEK